MHTTASDVFAFLEQHPDWSIEKHEISSAYFGAVRRSVRGLVAKLGDLDDDAAHDISESLRMILSEALTAPVSFDALAASVRLLGDPADAEARWGQQVRCEYEDAIEAAELTALDENPIRVTLRTLIGDLRRSGHTFRIYCHRRARAHFKSLFADDGENALRDDHFLTSVSEYRDAQPFDVLVKIGPLRSRGWGAAPDAILNAPRFGRLVHIVWVGCADEADFGLDPIAPAVVGASEGQGRRPGDAVHWTRNTVRTGDDLLDSSGGGSIDELMLFQNRAALPDLRRAILVQVDDAHGILYPQQSEVASFDPAISGNESIGYRQPGISLVEGTFVIWPLLEDPDLGGLKAGDGSYSRVWKARLREEHKRDPDGLTDRLLKAGLDLQHLRSAVRHWWRPPSTVIHAPQQRKHFEILARVLGLDHELSASQRVKKRPWWQYAWTEIGRSRGEAIQTGMQEHEIVEEQLFALLRDLDPTIQAGAAEGQAFDVKLPAGRALAGTVRFYRVCSVDEGYAVPDTLLKALCELATVEQWRV